MSSRFSAFPPRFLPALQAIARLEAHERYSGAFLFGSLARHETSEHSDCDVQVIVNEDRPCAALNHPFIEGVKLDLTFLSLAQLQARTHQEIAQGERLPLLAEAVILFDKTGQLARLQEQARQARPRKMSAEELRFLHFQIFHGNNKVERNLATDPLTALLVMHVGLNEFLKYHYRLHQQWWVSSKRLLADLRRWDLPLAQLIEQFVTACDVRTKFAFWSAIIDHLVAPLGGRQPIADNLCACSTCQHDLSLLFSPDQGRETDNGTASEVPLPSQE